MRTLLPLLCLLVGCAEKVPSRALAAEAPARAPAISSELAAGGPLRTRLPAPDDADLVLLYGAEQMGSLSTCGCPKNPRGSLARVQGYRVALTEARPELPTLLLNAGNWLLDAPGRDHDLRDDARVANRFMLEGLQLGGWDVLNVGYRDLPFLAEAGFFPEAAVSANLRAEPGLPAPAPFRVLQVGELRVAVTGVSPLGKAWMQPEGYHWLPLVSALREVVPQMREAADLVVVLAYDVGRDAHLVTRRVPGVDVLIEAGEFRGRFEPAFEDRTLWVRAGHQTMRLGELRLRVEDGAVRAALDRQVDLDAAIPSEPELRRLDRAARREIEAVQRRLFGP